MISKGYCVVLNAVMLNVIAHVFSVLQIHVCDTVLEIEALEDKNETNQMFRDPHEVYALLHIRKLITPFSLVSSESNILLAFCIDHTASISSTIHQSLYQVISPSIFAPLFLSILFLLFFL